MSAPPPPEGTLPLGTLGRAVGLRGEQRLVPDSEAAVTALAVLDEVWVEGLGTAALLSLRRQGRRWIVELAGVRRRERAEALVGARLYGRAEALPTGDAPHPGAPVERDGVEIGSVVALRSGPQELVVIRVGGSEALLPLVAPYVRWDGHTLSLDDPPEGLLP